MAKGSRGGQRAGGSLSGFGTIQPNVQPIQQNQPQPQPQIDDTQQAPAFSAQYDAFMQMTDDEKADVISTALKQGVPMHLNDQSDFQKFVYNVGLNDKPDVVSDATLDSMHGTELFRTVNAMYDSKNDIGYTAPQMAKQVQAGRVTYVSSGGTAVYGSGIYFANDYGSSTAYGRTRGDAKKTVVMRAKLNSNAKTISYSSASHGVSAEIASGSKLGKVLKRVGSDSRESVYAMAKGFNVITSGHGYFNVLNRNAITMSSDVRPVGNRW